MKTYVGDYRAKMADQASAETKSAKSDIELKIKNSNSAKSDSTFIKKATPQVVADIISEKQEFLFNFKLETTSVCADTNGDYEESSADKPSEAETENIQPMDLKETVNGGDENKD